ncbi:hypothetical protein GCM10008933_43980 [Paenibacillus motobuensis]|uniref:Uncharacterized protein n=1 Tax=Paenibacillus motobuensis TaxID=295324 RepID=A0ABP3INR6_9BACL
MEWSDLQEIAYDNLNDALFFAASGQAETRAFAIRGGICCSYLQDISTAYILEEFKIALHECENYFHDRRIG